MAKEVRIFIAELLQAYEEVTGKTCTEMALDFDVTLSNLYKYRNGKGNPTAKTIDKIIKAVEENCPELLENRKRLVVLVMNRRKQPEVYDLLYQLGVTTNYTGFFHTAYAVSLCVEQPDRLLLVTKWLYPEVAKQYKTNWKAVERNIRTVSCIIWQEGRPLLEDLAHRHLEQKPRNAQMLAILASSLDTGPLAVHGLGEVVALPGEDDDVGVADESVNEGRCETIVAEDGVPLAELQVGGNDEAPALITV